MTYFAFLGLFLVVPLLLLWARAGRSVVAGPRASLSEEPAGMAPGAAIALTAVVALAYTTPWDNFLVATGVWFYDPSLVAGVTLGYVPLEEYLFFVLQTAMTGLAYVILVEAFPPADGLPEGSSAAPEDVAWGRRLRRGTAAVVAAAWLVALVALLGPRGNERYAALLLAWALPPIALQLGYGADLLWRARRPVAVAILGATAWLSLADWVAVGAGTWGFDDGLLLGVAIGRLPVEEVLFFLLTNTLVVFSVALLCSPASAARFRAVSGLPRSLRA